MFRASLCPSSGEQECALPHMVFCTGCDCCSCVELGRELCALSKLLFDYAHHQENKSVHCRIWCSALDVMAVVAWSWDASCVHCERYCCASACNTDTTQTQPHQISNTQRNKNKITNVVIQQYSRKLLMMDILMSETC